MANNSSEHASQLALGDDPLFTPPSHVDNAYFSAGELFDNGLSNFDEELFYMNLCADDYWQSLGFDQCSPASKYDICGSTISPPCLFDTVQEGETGPPAITPRSANYSDLFKPVETSADIYQDINTSSPVYLPPSSSSGQCTQANQSPFPETQWIQGNQSPLLGTPSIYANQPWTFAKPDVWTDLEANEQASIYYNGECKAVSRNFFTGQVPLSAAVTGFASSDIDIEKPLYSPCMLHMEADNQTLVVQHQLEPATIHETMMGSSSETKCSDSEVYLLVMDDTLARNDGYAWRKYGQKKIKETIHPRAYFRCAHPGCSVKKHIEYSSHVYGAVLITYINKHNH